MESIEKRLMKQMKEKIEVAKEMKQALKVALDCLGSFNPPEDEGETIGFYEDMETVEQAIKRAEEVGI